MRIVSLLPAATEIVCAIGAEEELVGLSHECDYPSRLPALPRLTRSRLETDGLSAAIHRSMTALLEQALSIYEVDAGGLAALEPDVVITQDLCEVCAVSDQAVREALVRCVGAEPELVRLHPRCLEDIYEDIRRVGTATDHARQAVNLVETLRARMAHLADAAASLSPRSVLMIEWLDPVMIGGMWSEDLASAVGARAPASSSGEHARTLGREALADIDPDVVVIKPCGFDLERGLAEVEHLPRYLPWSRWRAAAQGRVYLVDGNAYFNRPGPRIVDSAEILAACIHPASFPDLRGQYAGGVRRVYPDLSIGAFDGE